VGFFKKPKLRIDKKENLAYICSTIPLKQ